MEGAGQGVLLTGFTIGFKMTVLGVGFIPNLGRTTRTDPRGQLVLLLPIVWQERTVIYFVELQIRIAAQWALGFLDRGRPLR